MKEEKLKQKKFKIIEAYSVLILIATLFMSIGYAEITDTTLVVDGKTEAVAQEGIFITNVVNTSNTNADIQNSKINYYTGTILDSTVTLGNTSESSITYEVTVYNKYDTEYVFIGAITDTEDLTLYSNSDIIYDMNNIQEYVTTIPSNESITFTITFKYKSGADLTNKTLISKLNFRFQELPKLVLSNDGKTYELNNIYPGYTPQEYTFTVSNYDNLVTNNVPLQYSLNTTIEGPLTAKIYDASGNEINGNISIDGDGVTKITHTYKLKIIWDAANNDSSYISQNYKCSVNLKAVTNNEKYLNYTISKGFNVNITTGSFNFNLGQSSASVAMDYNVGTLGLTIKNYNLSNVNDYNAYNANYEVSLKDENQFAVSIQSGGQTVIGGSAVTHNLTLKFVPTENVGLLTQKTVTLRIVSTSPYVKEIEIPVTITKTIMLEDLIRDGMAGNYLQKNYTVKDNAGTTITVPYGFQATNVTYNVSEGVVMQDQKGNQFVWVPVDGTNVTYTKWSQFTNPDLVISSTSDDTLPTGISSESDQITKYKGFWVGRYEAGKVNVDSASASTNNSTNIELLIRKGAQPWNFITYANAKIVAENYASNSYVQSGLVTRTQWDTIAKWAQNSGKDVYTNDSTWGMFVNTTGLTISGRYSISDGIGASGPQTWQTGNYTKSSWSAVFIGTGLNENSKFKNIYDLLGNVWEWTTEIIDGKTNRMFRGSHAGATGNMLSYWEGHSTVLAMYSLGFRVVLYIK